MMPPLMCGGAHGRHLLRRGDRGGEWSALVAPSWMGSGVLDVALSSNAYARCALPAMDASATAAVRDSPRVQYGERSYLWTPGSSEFQTLTAPPSPENRPNQTLNHAKLIWDPRSKTKGLLGGHLNIRSIVSKSNQLEHLLSHSNLDFLGLSETCPNKCSPEAVLDIPGYNMFRRDRNKGKGGGLLVYVKNTITCNLIERSQEIDMEYFGLNMSLSHQMSFTVICQWKFYD